MISPRSPEREARQAELFGKASGILMVGALLAIIWWFTPETPENAPITRREAALRELAAELYSQKLMSEDPQACEYGNGGFLACGISAAEIEKVTVALAALGWRQGSESNPAERSYSYERNRFRAYVMCSRHRLKSECAIHLHYPSHRK